MTARRAVVGLLALLVTLDIVIFVIRAMDVPAMGRLILLPAEGNVLYPIWKVRHGYPIYEWPDRPYYSLSLYNFLFYRVYAAIFDLLRVSNDGMAIAGRFITPAFACAGAAAQYAAGRRFVPATFRVPLALLSVAAWFGAVLPGWWGLAIRPDVAAAAFGTCGIAAALTAFARRPGQTPNAADGGEGGRSSNASQTIVHHANRVRPGWLVVAGCAFLLEWTFKQSQIALFVATSLYVFVWRRSVKGLVLVAAPLAIGAVAAMLVGGAVYRACIFDAARVTGLIAYLAVYWYRSLALTDLLLWGTSLYAIVALVRPGSVHGPLRSIAGIAERSRQVFGADLTYPALLVVVSAAADAVILAKIGSSLNHALELKVAGTLACAAVLGSMWESPKAGAFGAAAALMLVPMVAFNAACLVNEAGRVPMVLLLHSQQDPLHLTTAAIVKEREQFETVAASLPKPMFSADEMFSQPWHANGDRYPAVVVDNVYYDTARRKGLVGRGVEGLFEDRYFASAVLPGSSAQYLPALRAGYQPRGSFASGGQTVWILVRD